MIFLLDFFPSSGSTEKMGKSIQNESIRDCEDVTDNPDESYERRKTSDVSDLFVKKGLESTNVRSIAVKIS